MKAFSTKVVCWHVGDTTDKMRLNAVAMVGIDFNAQYSIDIDNDNNLV